MENTTNFVEKNRSTAHNGDIHIHSEAYCAIQEFKSAKYLLETEESNLREAKKSVSEAKKKLQHKKDELLNALQNHYGAIPEAIDVWGEVLLISDDEYPEITVVTPRQMTDLYRIERKDSE
jgi:hypothetical protein